MAPTTAAVRLGELVAEVEFEAHQDGRSVVMRATGIRLVLKGGPGGTGDALVVGYRSLVADDTEATS